ncbi:ADP-ribosyltransferase [Streptomyces sp. NPDC048664]|uniref:ADP-ribosyltransferase n=1 Tax=Streptomyces sp. NPDC048664 TaxID=3154505 RepID=UPI00343439E8
MIDPGRIPRFTGDLARLEKACAALRTVASDVRATGAETDRRFQGLAAYYTAPEARRLFATTKPVVDRADGFATGLETAAGALAAYAAQVQPLIARLERLRADAADFTASVRGDDDWERDGDKVEAHNRIRDDVTATVAAFWAAERECHNRISAVWCGVPVAAGAGYSAAALAHARLPWGDPVERETPWYDVGHWAKSFVWDGIVVDGVWGTLKGLGELAGAGGWDAMGQAWKGLAELATGLAVTSLPGTGALFWTLPDRSLPSWLRESRAATKRTGKALVAWDEWRENPARAAGAVTFNVVTTVLTGGEGAGLAARAARAVDPMTYASKAATAGLTKLTTLTKTLKLAPFPHPPTAPRVPHPTTPPETHLHPEFPDTGRWGQGGADGGRSFQYVPSMSERAFSGLATDAEKHAAATAELVHGTNPAPSLSNGAGLEYGNAHWGEFLDDLEPASRKSLATYTSSAYDEINGHLRFGTETSPETLHTIAEMDKVMGARPVPEEIMVVRGTGIEHLQLDTPLDMRGGVYDDKAYTSTALGKTPPPPFEGKPVWIHLRVPKGTPALWLDRISEFPGERELLLARGTQYRVTRVFMDEAGKWHVYGQVLARP